MQKQRTSIARSLVISGCVLVMVPGLGVLLIPPCSLGFPLSFGLETSALTMTQGPVRWPRSQPFRAALSGQGPLAPHRWERSWFPSAVATRWVWKNLPEVARKVATVFFFTRAGKCDIINLLFQILPLAASLSNFSILRRLGWHSEQITRLHLQSEVSHPASGVNTSSRFPQL